MIFDSIKNIDSYVTLNKGFAKAFAFLKRTDLMDLSVDKYDIDGDKIFAIVAKDTGRKKGEAELETHNKYIDIQLVLGGVDEMGWMAKSLCKQTSIEYDPENDIQFFKDSPDVWMKTTPGMFAIFFPEDAHLPLISDGEVHKVIVKIATNQE